MSSQNKKNQLMSETDILYSELDIITSLYLDINEKMDITMFLNALLENLRNVISFDGANVAFIDDQDIMTINKIDHKKISSKAKLSYDYLEQIYAEKIDYKKGKILACLCARENRELYYPEINPEDFEEEVKERIINYGITSLYYLPIHSKNRVLGVMRFHNYGGTMYLSDFEKNLIRRRVVVIARAMENFLLYDELKHKSMLIDKDLEQARRFQQNMIPTVSPLISGIDMAIKYLPMQKVGGDFFDYLYPVKEMEDCIGILLTDVSGHGVTAAFITSMLKVIFHSDEVKEFGYSSGNVMKILNRNIIGKIADNFVTAVYFLLDLKKKSLRISSAGHNAVILVDKNTCSLELIKPSGKPLGLLEDIEFEEIELILSQGHRLILYTDGLTEAVNPRQEDFENQFLELCITGVLSTPAEFIETVEASLIRHAGGSRDYLEDDVALVVIDICI